MLNEEFSLQYDRNPIESIKSRIKSMDGIFKKAKKKNIPITMEGIEEGIRDIAVELFDHGNNSLKLYGLLLRNYRVAKKALLLSDMKENEILKLLGLTEKQMRGIRAYRKLPEERLDTVMSILIEAMNRTKISFGNERNLFIQTMAKLIIL